MDKEKQNSLPQDEELEVSHEDKDEESVDEIQLLSEQLKACEDKYLRTHADFENIKRRMEKEKSTAISYAHEQFSRDLLPIIDSLDMALSTCEKDQCDVDDNLLDDFSDNN